LKYLNGSRLVIPEGYETALPRLKQSSSDKTLGRVGDGDEDDGAGLGTGG
jgi:hypothetical protein